MNTRNIGSVIRVRAKSSTLQKYCKTYGFVISKADNKFELIRNYEKIEEGLIDIIDYNLYLDMKNIEKME